MATEWPTACPDEIVAMSEMKKEVTSFTSWINEIHIFHIHSYQRSTEKVIHETEHHFIEHLSKRVDPKSHDVS